jgi:apolipoprotein N-acyltransferase
LLTKTNTTTQKLPPLTGKQIWTRLVFSFILGLLLCFSFAPFYAWFIAIFAPVIVFKFWQRLAAKWVFVSGLLFGAGFYTAGTSWIYHSVIHFTQASSLASFSLTLLFILYFSFYYALLAIIMKLCFNLRSNIQILLALPILWVAMEWLIGHLFTGFPWLLIGYSQVTSPLHVFAPYVGVYGLSYITMLMAAILIALTQPGNRKSYLMTWGLLIIIVALSTWVKHTTWTTPSGNPQKVSIVQAQLEPALKWQPSTLTDIETTYLDLTKPYWQSADLIIWPESALPVLPEQIKPWLNDLQQKLKTHNTHLITGIITNVNDKYFNSAMLLSPNQKPQFLSKRHLVPFGEYFPMRSVFGAIYKDFQVPMSDLSAGPYQQPLLHYSTWKIASYICYEIAYTEEVIQTMHDANLLLVISDDSWFGHSIASYQHLGIAQMRALETGRYLIFSNDTGPSAIVKPTGEIAQSIAGDKATVLSGSVTQMTGETPYMHYGNWPLVIFLSLLASITIAYSIFMHIKIKNEPTKITKASNHI